MFSVDEVRLFPLPSLVGVLVFAFVLTAYGFLVLATSRSADTRRNLFFAIGFLLRGIGFIGIAFRGYWPDVFSVYLSNMLVVAGLVLFYSGASVAAGRGPRYLLGIAFFAVSGALNAVLQRPEYGLHWRVAAISFIEAIPTIATGIAFARGSKRGNPAISWILASIFALSGMALAFRGVLAALTLDGKRLYLPGLAMAIAYYDAIGASVFYVAGLVAYFHARSKAERP